MKAWKHHIAEHFIENPSLIKNNGAGKDATIFLDYQKMVEYLNKTDTAWYIAEIEVEESEITRLKHGMATIHCVKISKTGFKPFSGE